MLFLCTFRPLGVIGLQRNIGTKAVESHINKKGQYKYEGAYWKKLLEPIIEQVKKKHKRVQMSREHAAGPLQYVFYAVLNTDLNLNQGAAAAQIAKGLMSLHSILENDQIKSEYVENWMSNGQKIIILEGFDHKHLRYLEQELKFTAIGSYGVRQSWGRNRSLVVLVAFGLKEDLEDVFEGLSYLR